MPLTVHLTQSEVPLNEDNTIIILSQSDPRLQVCTN